MKVARIISIVILWSFCVAHVALGIQSSPEEIVGRINGEVTDPRGYYIPDVELIFESPDRKYRVRTDSDGKYEAQFPPGMYRVSLERLGFRKFQKKNIHVEPNGSTTLNIRLKFGKPIVVDGEHP